MSRWWRASSVRLRLTLWYAGVLAAILLLFATGLYLFLRQNLYSELDRQLHDDFEAAEEILERGPQGQVQSRGHARHERDARVLEVWSLQGHALYREGTAELGRPVLGAKGGVVARTVREASGAYWRVRSAAYPIAQLPALIRVGRSEARLRHQLDQLLVGIALGLPLAVALACLGGYLLAGRALAPVGQMAARARTISAERLGERLPIENPGDELGQLGSVFNQTLARLERSFEALRRFTADAAHELRTPLTALKAVGELGLRDATDESACREVIGSMLEEADRLARLTDTLLMLTRGEARKAKLEPKPVELAGLCQQIVALLGVLAEEKGQSVTVEGSALEAWAEPQILRQALINILDNAIKHSPAASHIRVVVSSRQAEAVVEVFDQGPGVPVEHQERIFERFYRVDKARARNTGGAGLGLAIARWAVEAHGGRIEVENRDAGGCCFRICLPPASQKSTVQT